eukprot:Skav234930  [mRNA]  locus=scaffold2677:71164:77238:- [translate_table: standard]
MAGSAASFRKLCISCIVAFQGGVSSSCATCAASPSAASARPGSYQPSTWRNSSSAASAGSSLIRISDTKILGQLVSSGGSYQRALTQRPGITNESCAA